ncbi:uncharacterized protein T551_03638 [Pneumocystis jirovecii RU7]|uniref:SDE2-like domain-containing protein n=1 Tax=Pneumocystis jirovecii (strain RU7) TaxID=1408657 RepID=A0A0W4ZCC4_PNEJ7|nr:uncharacterized protein T551_03638 [Pneumocystis jirovecii RU7]KTW26066.1 hypothetical protein T551_03638 [Pneumocystis jirovecii RU7]
MINNIITTFPPFKTVSVVLSDTSTIKNLEDYLSVIFPSGNYLLSHFSGRPIYPEETLISLLNHSQYSNGKDFCMFRYVPRILGGKGGFGSQLRAAGGRMSSRKKRGEEENKLSCRDLNGRRIRKIKEEEELAKYIETASVQKREILAKRKRRLQAIIDAKPLSQRIKFDDNKYLEKNEMMIDDVKNTVKLVMEKSEYNSKITSMNGFNITDNPSNINKEQNTNSIYSKVLSLSTSKTSKRVNKWDEEFISSDDSEELEIK